MSFASVCLHAGSLPVNTCTPFEKYTRPSSLPLKMQLSHDYRKWAHADKIRKDRKFPYYVHRINRCMAKLDPVFCMLVDLCIS